MGTNVDVCLHWWTDGVGLGNCFCVAEIEVLDMGSKARDRCLGSLDEFLDKKSGCALLLGHWGDSLECF